MTRQGHAVSSEIHIGTLRGATLHNVESLLQGLTFVATSKLATCASWLVFYTKLL